MKISDREYDKVVNDLRIVCQNVDEWIERFKELNILGVLESWELKSYVKGELSFRELMVDRFFTTHRHIAKTFPIQSPVRIGDYWIIVLDMMAYLVTRDFILYIDRWRFWAFWTYLRLGEVKKALKYKWLVVYDEVPWDLSSYLAILRKRADVPLYVDKDFVKTLFDVLQKSKGRSCSGADISEHFIRKFIYELRDNFDNL